MKKIIHVGLLSFLLIFSSLSAQAALLIEPVVGFSSGKAELTITDNSPGGDVVSGDESIKGLSYGGRLGFQNLGFQVGLDYLASAMKFDGEKWDTSELGGFVGFEFPVLFRVYAGYIFSGSAKVALDDDTATLKSGTGPKFGIGMTLLPFLDVNLEYRSVKYDTADISSLYGAGTDISLDGKYNAIMLGVSFPLTLF